MSLTYCKIGYETGDYGSGSGTTTSIGITNISYNVNRSYVVAKSLDIVLGEKHYTTKQITGTMTLSYRDTAAGYLFDSLFGVKYAKTFSSDMMGVPLVIDVLEAKTPVRLCGVIITHIKITIEPKVIINISADFVARTAITQAVDTTISYTDDGLKTAFNTSVEFTFGGSTKSYAFTTKSVVIDYNRNANSGSFGIESDLMNKIQPSGPPEVGAKFVFAEHEYNVFNDLLLTYSEIDDVYVYLKTLHSSTYAYLNDISVDAPSVHVDGLKIEKSVTIKGFNNSGFIR